MIVISNSVSTFPGTAYFFCIGRLCACEVPSNKQYTSTMKWGIPTFPSLEDNTFTRIRVRKGSDLVTKVYFCLGTT